MLQFRRLAPVLAAAISLAPTAVATELVFRSLEELARVSDACVVARVDSASTGWSSDHRIIVTSYELTPLDVLQGAVPPGSLTVTRVGGELDGMALSYEGMPSLQVGELAGLFLLRRSPSSFVIASLKQGVLRQRGGLLVRDLSQVAGAPVGEEVLTLQQFTERVRAGLDPGSGSRRRASP